ncbi:MAG TPA: amidohydrolase family protein [Gemmatimonadales bacterium]|nr:amidohydrolase family protein [Gemmatimonadales bacterium]
MQTPRIVTGILLTGLAAGGPPRGAAPAVDAPLVIAGGRYLDVRAGALRPNGYIVIRGDRIESVLPPDADRPAHARILRADGRTILPGLVDAHVHLTLAGDPLANAAATVRAGFTTVVDLGAVGGAGIRLRDALASGDAPGPRVIAAGSWIGAKGGVCEFGAATVRDAAGARARAESDLAAGADLLKVCVTGWPADAIARPDSVELRGPMLQAVLDVATARRRAVFAHAIGQAGALLAARSGVRALAHTPIVDSAAVAGLRENGVHVISTLATLGVGKAAEPLRASFARLRRAGVPIVLGTDAGVLPHGENAKELVALTREGLTPLEAIRAATLAPAELLGIPGLGSIETGSPGDLVIVEGDPLTDITALQGPLLVVRRGREVQ